MSQKLNRFLSEHRSDRALTVDLLRSLSVEELEFSPGPGVGKFWKQFRHVGRVQENYVDALDTGAVKFQNSGASFNGTADSASLVEYLTHLDKKLEAKLKDLDENITIDWFGAEKLTAFDHLLRMLGHETLHHGQWIVYFKLMNKKFPESWQIWGL